MTVPVQTPYNSYIYAGSATFIYEFQIILSTDLQVSVAGVVQPAANYTISGVGVQAGGSILYTGPLVMGQLVELQRVTVLQRSTDYQTEGDFLAATFNADFDRLWMAQQELQRSQVQAIRIPEAGGVAVLPAAAARANTFLGFDLNGTLVLLAGAVGSAASLALQYAGAAGSSLIGFIQAGANAILRTSQDKHRERISIQDFSGCDPTGATSSQTALDAFYTKITSNPQKYRGVMPAGIYKYSVSPNWAVQGLVVEPEGEVRLRYTGTGYAVLLDAGPSAYVYNVVFGKQHNPFHIECPSTALDGIYARSFHHGKVFAKMHGAGAGKQGCRIEFAVNSEFSVTVSATEEAWYTGAAPAGGIYATRRGAGENTNGCIFHNPIVEGISGAAGLTLDYAGVCRVIGGTSENNTALNVQCTANSYYNTFDGIDLEFGTLGSLNCNGIGNRFVGVLASQLVTLAGRNCQLLGGSYDAIAHTGSGNQLLSIEYGSNGGAITDSGTHLIKQGCYNITTGVWDKDKAANGLETSTSCLTGAATTVLTLPATGDFAYSFEAYISSSGAPATYYATATIVVSAGTVGALRQQNNGTLLTIAMSGLNVQVTQTSGLTQTVIARACPR